MFRRVAASYRQAFGGLPRAVWLLSGITLIHRSGTMVLPFLTLYLTVERSMSVIEAGRYMGLYGLGGVCGALVGGWLDQHLGSKRAMALTLMVAAVGFLALGWVREPWVTATVLFLTSLAAEGFRTPSSAALGRATTPDIRARAFGLRRLAINLGMSAGPALGGVLATVDYLWLFVADGATCLAAACVVLWLPAVTWLSKKPAPDSSHATFESAEKSGVPAPRPRAPRPWAPRPWSWLNRRMVGFLAATVLLNLAFAQLFATYPLSLSRDLAISEVWIGLLLASNTLLIVAFEMVLLHRFASSRPLRVIALGALAQAAGFLVVPFGERLSVAFVGIGILTLGEMLTHPVAEGFVANRVPEAMLGRAMGVLTACFSIVFVLAPILGTWVYEAYGHRVLWTSCVAVSVIAAVGFVAVDARSLRGASTSRPGNQ